jgi:hypothetical protein
MTVWNSRLGIAAVAVMMGILFGLGVAAAKTTRNETTTAADDFWDSDIFHLPPEGKKTRI